MAFALTSFFADGTKFQGPGLYRAQENLVFTITGTTADVALDIGNYSGTFWTAALADATYGTMAGQIKTELQKITAQAQCVSRVYTPELNAAVGQIQAATTSGVTYTLAVDATTKLPNYTMASSNGLLAYTVFVDLLLNPYIYPVVLSFNLG